MRNGKWEMTHTEDSQDVKSSVFGIQGNGLNLKSVTCQL